VETRAQGWSADDSGDSDSGDSVKSGPMCGAVKIDLDWHRATTWLSPRLLGHEPFVRASFRRFSGLLLVQAGLRLRSSVPLFRELLSDRLKSQKRSSLLFNSAIQTSLVHETTVQKRNRAMEKHTSLGSVGQSDIIKNSHLK